MAAVFAVRYRTIRRLQAIATLPPTNMFERNRKLVTIGGLCTRLELYF